MKYAISPGLCTFFGFLAFIKKNQSIGYTENYVEEEIICALPGFPYPIVTRIVHGSQAFSGR